MAFASRCLAPLLVAVGGALTIGALTIGALTIAAQAAAEPVYSGGSAQSVIDGLKADGYNVVINWLTGYDTVPLSLCTVSDINNPDDTAPPAGTFTTVYIDVSCPNHHDG
jgi:hypothetical protein